MRQRSVAGLCGSARVFVLACCIHAARRRSAQTSELHRILRCVSIITNRDNTKEQEEEAENEERRKTVNLMPKWELIKQQQKQQPRSLLQQQLGGIVCAADCQ